MSASLFLAEAVFVYLAAGLAPVRVAYESFSSSTNECRNTNTIWSKLGERLGSWAEEENTVQYAQVVLIYSEPPILLRFPSPEARWQSAFVT
jgi:hypothetical protein